MTTQESISGYKFSILSEDVSSADLFEDKTHERVSDNLYRIINQSEKSVTIGLEGSWGSGKSTVIRLLKEKLREDPDDKTLFFMFDAWAHDGDPLRRIFLESIIREIDPNEASSELNKIKGRITGKTKTVTVKSLKKASRLGKFISFFALLIPLGSALLARVNYDLLVSPFSSEAGQPYWQFLFGLILCLSPLFVLMYWILNGDKAEDSEANPWRSFWKSISWANKWKILSLEKLREARSWEFFTVDSKEDYTQDITEDGERTSIEFEDYFKCIIEKAMDHGLIDRCIIVIDNLDRVDPDHAKNIWSTLQTFFQKRSSADSDGTWSDKVWFVIPFDRDGFNKIWKSNNENDEAGKSFLKKCFQLIAEVPHPVMSGWSGYAKRCIDESLSQWPENERVSALSTYVRYTSRLDVSPTPRDIKIFSNQVGLLGSMWGGQVSVEAICLYLLFKESLTTQELRNKLVSGQLPNNYQTDIDRSVIFSELAGLLFGVNRQKGLQLLLGPEIKAAFNKGDGKVLASLLEDHSDAFWIAYESSRRDWAVGVDHTDEYKISATKAFNDGLISHKDRIRHDILKLMDVWVGSFDKLNFSEFDYSISFNSLIEFGFGKDNFISSLHDFMTAKFKGLINSVGDDKFPEKTLPNINKVVHVLENNNKPLLKSEYPNLNSDNWKEWLNYLKKSGTSFDFVLPKSETIKSLVNESQFNTPNPNHEVLVILSKTFDVNPNSTEWEFAVENITSWMLMRHRAIDYDVIYDLSIKLSMYGDRKYLSNFEKCLKTQSFWTWVQNESCNKNPSLPILAAIVFQEDLQKSEMVSSEVKSFWSKNIDNKEINKIFSRFKAIDNLDVIWMLLRDKNNKVAELIVRNIDDKDLFSSADGAIYLDTYDLDAEDILGMAKKFADNNAFFVYQDHMKEKPLTYQTIYKIFRSINNSEISSFIDNEIRNYNEEIWKECIENNGDLLDLVNDKNPRFSKALNEYLISMVSGSVKLDENSRFVKKLSGLLRKVTDLNKSFIPKVIRRYFENEVDYLNDVTFLEISPFLSGHLTRVDEANLLERLCVWINERKLDRIKWLIEQDIKGLKDPSEDLIELVKLWISSENAELNDIAVKVKDKFGLVINNPDVSEGE